MLKYMLYDNKDNLIDCYQNAEEAQTKLLDIYQSCLSEVTENAKVDLAVICEDMKSLINDYRIEGFGMIEEVDIYNCV